MVSLGPAIQGLDMKSMYDFSDKRQQKPKISYPKNSLMDIIDTHSDFTIFKMVVKKAKLEMLLCNDTFTLFVPSDYHLKQKYKLEFFEELDIGMARRIVHFSMMSRKMDKVSIQCRNSGRFPTLDRSNSMYIKTETSNDSCESTIENFIKVIHWNQPAVNGIIHVIDDFLMPACNSS
jgi:uncharacterized surface protein with fasciclin (FAS1) repeats